MKIRRCRARRADLANQLKMRRNRNENDRANHRRSLSKVNLVNLSPASPVLMILQIQDHCLTTRTPHRPALHHHCRAANADEDLNRLSGDIGLQLESDVAIPQWSNLYLCASA